MIRLKMKNYSTILPEKQQKKSSEYTCKEILTSDPSRIIEQAKFTYSPLGKALEKQTKMIEEQGEK